MNPQIESIYNHLKRAYPDKDMGSIEDFSSFVSTPEGMEFVYDKVKNSTDKNVGSVEDFGSFLNVKKPKAEVENEQEVMTSNGNEESTGFLHPMTIKSESGGDAGARSQYKNPDTGFLGIGQELENSFGLYQFNLENGELPKFLDWAEDKGIETPKRDAKSVEKWFRDKADEDNLSFGKLQEEYVVGALLPSVTNRFDSKFQGLERDHLIDDLLISTRIQYGNGGYKSIIKSLPETNDREEFVNNLTKEKIKRFSKTKDRYERERDYVLDLDNLQTNTSNSTSSNNSVTLPSNSTKVNTAPSPQDLIGKTAEEISAMYGNIPKQKGGGSRDINELDLSVKDRLFFNFSPTGRKIKASIAKSLLEQASTEEAKEKIKKEFNVGDDGGLKGIAAAATILDAGIGDLLTGTAGAVDMVRNTSPLFGTGGMSRGELLDISLNTLKASKDKGEISEEEYQQSLKDLNNTRNEFSNSEIAQDISNEVDQARSIRAYADKGIVQTFQEDGILSGVTKALGSVGESIPLIGASILNPTLGFSLIGGSVAGNKYNDLIDSGVSSNEAAAGAVVVGAAELLAERFTVGLAKGSVNKITKAFGKEALEQSVRKSAAQTIGSFTGNSGLEGLSEVGVTVTENLVNILTGVTEIKEDESVFSKLVEGTSDSFVAGLVGGATFSGPGAIAEMASNELNYRQAKSLNKDLSRKDVRKLEGLEVERAKIKKIPKSERTIVQETTLKAIEDDITKIINPTTKTTETPTKPKDTVKDELVKSGVSYKTANGDVVDLGSFNDGEIVDIQGVDYRFDKESVSFINPQNTTDKVGVDELAKKSIIPQKKSTTPETTTTEQSADVGTSLPKTEVTEQGSGVNLTPLREHYGDVLGELDIYENDKILPSKQINIGDTSNADYKTIEEVPQPLRDKLVKTDNFTEEGRGKGRKRSEGYRVEMTKGDVMNLLNEAPTDTQKTEQGVSTTEGEKVAQNEPTEVVEQVDEDLTRVNNSKAGKVKKQDIFYERIGEAFGGSGTVREKDGVKIRLLRESYHEVEDGEVVLGDSSRVGGRSDTIVLDLIESSDRGKGKASKALDQILAAADEAGLSIEINVQPQGKKGLDKGQLIDWYQKRGFKQLFRDVMVYDGDKTLITKEEYDQQIVNLSQKLKEAAKKLDDSLIEKIENQIDNLTEKFDNQQYSKKTTTTQTQQDIDTIEQSKDSDIDLVEGEQSLAEGIDKFGFTRDPKTGNKVRGGRKQKGQPSKVAKAMAAIASRMAKIRGKNVEQLLPAIGKATPESLGAVSGDVKNSVDYLSLIDKVGKLNIGEVLTPSKNTEVQRVSDKEYNVTYILDKNITKRNNVNLSTAEALVFNGVQTDNQGKNLSNKGLDTEVVKGEDLKVGDIYFRNRDGDKFVFRLLELPTQDYGTGSFFNAKVEVLHVGKSKLQFNKLNRKIEGTKVGDISYDRFKSYQKGYYSFGKITKINNWGGSAKFSSDNATPQTLQDVVSSISNTVSTMRSMLPHIDNRIKLSKTPAEKARYREQKEVIRGFIKEHSNKGKIEAKYSREGFVNAEFENIVPKLGIIKKDC